MESATDAACTLIEKRNGSVVLELSEYTSVEIWAGDAEGLAAVTLGSGYPRKGAESIQFYAMDIFFRGHPY